MEGMQPDARAALWEEAAVRMRRKVPGAVERGGGEVKAEAK